MMSQRTPTIAAVVLLGAGLCLVGCRTTEAQPLDLTDAGLPPSDAPDALPSEPPFTVPPEGYDPCAGRECGEPCSLCPPGHADCVEPTGLKACDAFGECRMTPVDCGGKGTERAHSTEAYAPCAGKECGDPCTLCPPGDRNCVETNIEKRCDENGDCRPLPVDCADAGVAPDDLGGRERRGER
jgi:hypothetical protein